MGSWFWYHVLVIRSSLQPVVWLQIWVMTRILVVGHSFIFRYRRFLERELSSRGDCVSLPDFDFAQKLGLPREEVFIVGRGGLKCDRQGISFVTNLCRRFRPELVVLEIGTNDLSNSTFVPNEQFGVHTAGKVVDLCRILHQGFGVRTVVVCKVVARGRFRRGVSEEDFASRRAAFNQELCVAARCWRFIFAWRHDRTCLNSLRNLSDDSIHVTSTDGMNLYNFSIRRAITTGLGHLRSSAD